MATADSVKAKLQGLIDTANNATGREDTDLSTAIRTLVQGFGSGGGGSVSGLAYDMGEFVLDTDTVSGKGISVPHGLGVTPEFICVWSDHWAGLTSDNTVSYDDAIPTAVGFVWLKEITGMIYRASSVNNGTPMCLGLHIANGDYRVSGGLPSSGSYGVFDDHLSEKAFCPPTFGVKGARYRTGVTYKYFVSIAWWNVGGVASAE